MLTSLLVTKPHALLGGLQIAEVPVAEGAVELEPQPAAVAPITTPCEASRRIVLTPPSVLRSTRFVSLEWLRALAVHAASAVPIVPRKGPVGAPR